MILNLKNGKIVLVPMDVPEAIQDVYVKYNFEINTNHLIPELIIEDKIYKGNRVFIDLRSEIYKPVLSLVVNLYNSNKVIVKTYEGNLPLHTYVVLGDKLIRPDIEAYIRKLEARIEQLENEGEVI